MNYIKNIIIYIFIYIPIIIFIYLLSFYSLNKPIGDDFDSVLVFLNNYEDINSIKDRFLHIFHPHNEYKLVFSNIFQILILEINGKINFVYMIFIAFFGHLLILYFLFEYFKSFKLSLLYFIPIPFLLFNLVQYDLSLWAMASMQSYYQFLFMFLSVYYLYKNRVYLFYLFFMFSMYQGGMWMPLTVIVIAKFLMDKTYKKLLLLFFLILFNFIFMKYTGINKPGHDIIQNALQIMGIIKFSLGVMGSIFNKYTYSIILSVTFIISFIYIIKTYKFEVLKNSLAFIITLILLVSIPALAINRIHTGIESSLSSRYSLISIFLLIFIYLFLIENTNKKHLKKIFYFFCFLSIFIYGYNLKYINDIKNRYNNINSNMYPAFNQSSGYLILNNSFLKNVFVFEEKSSSKEWFSIGFWKNKGDENDK